MVLLINIVKVFEACEPLEWCQLHYTPMHLQPYYRALGFMEGLFPDAEYYAKCAISLPLFSGLTVSEQESELALSQLLLNK